MGMNPSELHAISDLPTAHLRVWTAGQQPGSWYHQMAQNELVRRDHMTAWMKWGFLAGLAALTLYLWLNSMFLRE